MKIAIVFILSLSYIFHSDAFQNDENKSELDVVKGLFSLS